MFFACVPPHSQFFPIITVIHITSRRILSSMIYENLMRMNPRNFVFISSSSSSSSATTTTFLAPNHRSSLILRIYFLHCQSPCGQFTETTSVGTSAQYTLTLHTTCRIQFFPLSTPIKHCNHFQWSLQAQRVTSTTIETHSVPLTGIRRYGRARTHKRRIEVNVMTVGHKCTYDGFPNGLAYLGRVTVQGKALVAL